MRSLLIIVLGCLVLIILVCGGGTYAGWLAYKAVIENTNADTFAALIAVIAGGATAALLVLITGIVVNRIWPEFFEDPEEKELINRFS